jgi:hypothetical protein
MAGGRITLNKWTGEERCKGCSSGTIKKGGFERKVRNDAGAIQKSGERTRQDGQAQGGKVITRELPELCFQLAVYREGKKRREKKL